MDIPCAIYNPDGVSYDCVPRSEDHSRQCRRIAASAAGAVHPTKFDAMLRPPSIVAMVDLSTYGWTKSANIIFCSCASTLLHSQHGFNARGEADERSDSWTSQMTPTSPELA